MRQAIYDRLVKLATRGQTDPGAVAKLLRVLKDAKLRDPALADPDVEGGVKMPLPTRYLRVPGAVQLAANTQGNALTCLWPDDGEVVGLFLSVKEGTLAALAGLSLRVTIEGTHDITTDGQAATYLHAAPFMGTSGVGNAAAYVPMRRKFTRSTVWQVLPNNENAGGGAALTPIIIFGIRVPSDLE